MIRAVLDTNIIVSGQQKFGSQRSHRRGVSDERFLRQMNDQWLFTEAAEMDARLELPSIGCTLLLSDVYEKVRFEHDEQ